MSKSPDKVHEEKHEEALLPTQDNSLAYWVFQGQEFLKQHGGKVAVASVIVVAAGVFFYNRHQSETARTQTIISELENVRERVGSLRQGYLSPRDSGLLEAPAYLEGAAARGKSKGVPELEARALVLLGDFHWGMASLILRPEAATQPSLRPEKSEGESLDAAKTAYTAVLGVKDAPAPERAAALMGLAAVAESQAAIARDAGQADKAKGLWDEAEAKYKQIQSDATLHSAIKKVADMKLAALPSVKLPVKIEKVVRPVATQPTTQATLEPTTASTRGS